MESKVYIDPYPKTMKMLGLERINIDCGNNTSIVTPANIAKDMVALLPDEVFIPESKFLDICCKSGIFLTSIREKLMNSKAMIESYPDDKERYQYITNNQLYGIVPNGQCQMYSVRAVYGTLKVDNPHILCFGAFDQYRTACLNNNHKMLIDEMKKEFNTMKFDVVIGNPPYNKDLYLDFVTLGHTLASKYDCWITPAKWQAKGGQKNEDFRKNIVPYMSKIVYYPDCTDVFAIGDPGGISYFITDNNENTDKVIKNISLKHKYIGKDYIYNDEEKRQFNNILSNIGNELIHKLGKYKAFSVENTPKHKQYEAWSANKVSLVSNIPKTYLWSSDGVFNCLGLIEIIDTTQGNKKSLGVPEDSRLIYTADTKEECNYFKSWAYTRFVRFLLSLSLCGLTGIATSNEWWRFVPDPGAFDHIFTDEELYKKYNLTSEEINIIESVIKERK